MKIIGVAAMFLVVSSGCVKTYDPGKIVVGMDYGKAHQIAHTANYPRVTLTTFMISIDDKGNKVKYPSPREAYQIGKSSAIILSPFHRSFGDQVTLQYLTKVKFDQDKNIVSSDYLSSFQVVEVMKPNE